MSKLKFKNIITDNISDAREIVRLVGRGIENGNIDVPSALQNLSEAIVNYNQLKIMLKENETKSLSIHCTNSSIKFSL